MDGWPGENWGNYEDQRKIAKGDCPLTTLSAVGCHTQTSKFKFEKSGPQVHCYLQRAVIPKPASSNSKKVGHKFIAICSGLSYPTQQVQIRKKCAIRPLLSAAGCHTQPSKLKFEKNAPIGHYYVYAAACHTRLDGQYCPMRTYHGVFSRAEKSSDDITRCLFLKNMKWLNNESKLISYPPLYLF